MLCIIKGRAGSGKTSYMQGVISKVINNEVSRPVLIIPEQFSFETERGMLRLLGAKKHKAMDIFSFSRLAHSNLKALYNINKIPTPGVRAALMSEAIAALEGRLNIFNSCGSDAKSVIPLVDLCKELKYCCITPEILDEKTQLLEDGFLKDKLNEINLINQTYDALVTQSYFDDTDAVSIFTKNSIESGYFKGKTVFIDGFRAFSKQELLCFEVMLNQADNVYITLCTDEKITRFSPFYFIKQFETRLRTIASRNNVAVEEIYCYNNSDSFSSDIAVMERNIFLEGDIERKTTDNSVIIAQCSDISDECDYVAKEIKKLLRSGEYRCRDIAVIERTSGMYSDKIADCLKKLDIPVFYDSRRSLKFESLFIYVDSVLSCISTGFTSENVFSYLKSGLSSLDITQISKLEKYAIIWGINGNAWGNDFTMHPDGFGYEFSETDNARLEELNSWRKKAILPLLKLKKACCDTTGDDITRHIYDFLVEQNVKDKLYDLYTQLNEEGFSVEAQRQESSWNSLVQLFDTMASLFNEKYISVSRYTELFKMLVDTSDIGEIPQGLDEVKIGNAERIRTEKLKVVFLVGVNKDEFPLVDVGGGILTDSDRITLTSFGLDIRPPFEESVDEERFIVYCAVTASSDKLYLTYKSVNDDGSAAFKSEIVETALESIENIKIIKSSQCDYIDKIESDDSAFELLAKNYGYNSTLKSTLVEYFKDKPDYEHKINALENSISNKHFSFTDSLVSKKLFKDNIYLSASRVESFYNCPFSYFVRYGLKAEPLRVAELDPAQGGTVVHLVMETVLKRYPKAAFVEASDEELITLVKETLDDYLEEKMGGFTNKTKRFMFLFNRLVDVCVAIINRLKQEFVVGSFDPCDFELKIGGDEIPAYSLPLDEGSVTITGSVDRVDLMEKDGIKYVRIIDYKTGKKEFKLSELYSGLNIQMVLYLMALEKNGKEYYGDFLPSGVLYLPSRIGISDYLDSRSPDEETVKAKRRESGKLSGMVLDSPVVFNGMGVDKFPDYFPVGYSKKGELNGNKYSLLNFKNLSKIIDSKICNMGNALHNGEISAVPSGKDGEGKMCKYCSYKPICNHEFGDEINEVVSLSHSKALERLEGSDDEI